MKKISRGILKILISLIIIQFTYIPISQASFWGEIFETGDNFVEQGKNEVAENAAINGTEMKKQTDKIYTILITLGVALAVIIGAILGIKFMFGSIEEQVKAKETLIPYIVGCIVIFGAFGIWKLMVSLFSNIT